VRGSVEGGLPVGALTQAGLNQAVELGELIRSRFLEHRCLVGRDFDPSELRLRPTRTLRGRDREQRGQEGQRG
jgi:hypothetical protein